MTIVIPCFNEESSLGYLSRTLPSVRAKLADRHDTRVLFVDDCSTDLELRGLPVFRGLIGPMPENGNVIRYESPEVFETLTKDWGTVPPPRRARTRARTTRAR